ncbi:MAG TPA: MOSC N-terminal beta barrel domain-containing protein [Candidatus Limnocylindria bacterium]|jgi:uncharacterized protein YcbX|nr:MOSC N-terminal beta barrel domain-containing protein [Candidatus Limnocylindria bacterium]
MQVGTIAALWRYPVKALRAEALERADVLADGLAGDRTAALIVGTPDHPRAGKPYRGKESARLHRTADPAVALAEAVQDGVAITLDRSAPRWFDARPISLLFDLWVGDVEALVGEPLDPLRWRPNVFVHAAAGFTAREAALVGRTLRAGEVVLRVVEPIRRCVTTTYDVQTGVAEPRVLAEVARNRENIVGVYCETVAPGALSRGDSLTLD